MAIDGEQAQAHARNQALPGSAVAVHRVDISSANIPAVSFVITAILPTRRHRRNEAVRPDFPIGAVKSYIKGTRHLFLAIIANHYQLQEGARQMLPNGIVS
jgi:hypothetical protein